MTVALLFLAAGVPLLLDLVLEIRNARPVQSQSHHQQR